MLSYRRALILDQNQSSYGTKKSLDVKDLGQGTGLLEKLWDSGKIH